MVERKWRAGKPCAVIADGERCESLRDTCTTAIINV
jgi:hypothetical protein